MIYYAVLYMVDGQIHLMPHGTKEEAEKTIEQAKQERFGPKIKHAKVFKKDTTGKWFKEYWI